LFTCHRSNREGTLTEVQLKNLAIKNGDLISETTQKVLGSKLKEVLQQEGIPQALRYCNVHAYPIIDSLQTIFKADIRRASLHTRNPDNAPGKNEEEIIKEYVKNMHTGETPGTKVVFDKEHIIYYKPIILNSPLCLNCHGEVGKDITEENHQIIKSLYSNDQATGHKIGDLRGIWSISFSKDSFRDN
jgi:hypothetical protein